MSNNTVKLQDIAERANTSKTTVSRVLSNKTGSIVSKEKRKEIKKIAEELGYLPNRRARLFCKKSNNCIGFIMTNQFFKSFGARSTASLSMEMLYGVTEYLSKIDYTLHLSVEPEENANEYLKNEYVNEDKVDGIIMLGNVWHFPLVKELDEKNIPYVAFAPPQGMPFEGPTVSYSIDNAMRDLVRNMYDLGHRQIGCISHKKSQHISVRTDLLFSECQKAGIEIVTDCFVNANDETQAYIKTKEIIKRPKPSLPTALFYTSDHFAILGIRAILEEGLRIPEDISVIGYDGAKYTEESPVPLSTIHIPRKEMGEAAAKLLIATKNEKNDCPASVVLPGKFLLKKSLGEAR